MKGYSLKSFIKFLSKNKLYSIVTISGFSVSLMFVLLLSVYIKQELSVDQFHENKDRIYRLYREKGSTFGAPVGQFIKNQLPEVEAYTRIAKNGGNATFPGNNKILLNYLLADSSFFTMFSFKLLEGNLHEVLKTKDRAVLSQSFAYKTFGSGSPLGKSFVLNNRTFIISGVIEDMPQNTHFVKFDAVITFEMLAEFWNYPQMLTSNGNSSYGTYFLAKEGTDLPSKAPLILEQFKKDYWLYTEGFSKELKFEPLTDVYFSNSAGPAIRQNSRSSAFMFGGIAILILVIAIINYINLTVAQAGRRSKEIAIKKLVGGSKWTLMMQQISESVVLSLLAASIAVGLAFIAEPFFDNLMNSKLNLIQQFNVPFIATSLLVIALTGFVSGIVPALVANKFNPVEIVKGSFAFKTRKNYSKVLISFQYIVAIVLLVSTLTIARQSKFMQNYDMGFNKENLFWMDNTIETSRIEAFRNELKSIPGVEQVSFCSGMFIDGGNNQSFNYNGKPVSFQEFKGDSLYISIFGLKVNKTSSAYTKDGVWLNQTAVKEMELEDNPTSVKYSGQQLPVLGIIEDFHFNSLHEKVRPAIIKQLGNNENPWSILVKISKANLVETVDRIKKKQALFTGGLPVESGFVDAGVDQWYASEVKRSKLIGAFTLLSIIISSMGIFAMSLYYIQQKIKEIGIRKVNGAKVSEVVQLLNQDFLIWVMVSFIVACPVAYYIMDKWLKNFAYKTTLSWWIFALAGLLALGIAMLTISWQSWRAASRNPVESLKYE